MNESMVPARAAARPHVRPETCAYCGARLDPFYYFCTTCATPYTSVDSVLPSLVVTAPTEGELIRKKAPHVATLFWVYVTVVVTVAVLNYVLFENSRPDIAIFVQMTVLFVVTCVFSGLHWPALAVQLKRFGFGHYAGLLGLLALVPLLAINYTYHGWLLRELGAKSRWLPGRLRQLGLGEPGLIFFLCVFPAVLEEISFRGLVQHWLQIAVRPVRAIVLASCLFTVLHFSILSAPYIFAVGMVLGWVKWKTGSLYPGILIHFIHNLIVVEFFW